MESTRPTWATLGPFRVGEWEVRPATHRIRRAADERKLEPRVMNLLCFLADRAGEVVSREELLDTLWHERVVAASVLTRVVSLLRRALDDVRSTSRYIETISKTGYRLVAEVTPIDSQDGKAHSGVSLLVGSRQVELGPGRTVVGRGTEADVLIDHSEVSRRHARLTVETGRVVLEDLGSKNGTLVNGSAIRAPMVLADGDEILIGAVIAVFRDHRLESTETGSRTPIP